MLRFSSNESSWKYKYFFAKGITRLSKGLSYPWCLKESCTLLRIFPFMLVFRPHTLCFLIFVANHGAKVCTSSSRARIRSKTIFELSAKSIGYRKLLGKLRHRYFWAFMRTSKLIPFLFRLKFIRSKALTCICCKVGLLHDVHI